MAEFDLNEEMEDHIRLLYSESSSASRRRARWNYWLWCLGHNLDIVATILTMSGLSWQKGFDAGLVIADLAPAPRGNSLPGHRPVALGEDPTD